MTEPTPPRPMSPSPAELVNGLNIDLAHEYAAIIAYRTYASSVEGPWRLELRNFFEAEIPDELLHARALADKIVALGGVPTTFLLPFGQQETPEKCWLTLWRTKRQPSRAMWHDERWRLHWGSMDW